MIRLQRHGLALLVILLASANGQVASTTSTVASASTILVANTTEAPFSASCINASSYCEQVLIEYAIPDPWAFCRDIAVVCANISSSLLDNSIPANASSDLRDLCLNTTRYCESTQTTDPILTSLRTTTLVETISETRARLLADITFYVLDLHASVGRYHASEQGLSSECTLAVCNASLADVILGQGPPAMQSCVNDTFDTCANLAHPGYTPSLFNHSSALLATQSVLARAVFEDPIMIIQGENPTFDQVFLQQALKSVSATLALSSRSVSSVRRIYSNVASSIDDHYVVLFNQTMEDEAFMLFQAAQRIENAHRFQLVLDGSNADLGIRLCQLLKDRLGAVVNLTLFEDGMHAPTYVASLNQSNLIVMLLTGSSVTADLLVAWSLLEELPLLIMLPSRGWNVWQQLNLQSPLQVAGLTYDALEIDWSAVQPLSIDELDAISLESPTLLPSIAALYQRVILNLTAAAHPSFQGFEATSFITTGWPVDNATATGEWALSDVAQAYISQRLTPELARDVVANEPRIVKATGQIGRVAEEEMRLLEALSFLYISLNISSEQVNTTLSEQEELSQYTRDVLLSHFPTMSGTTDYRLLTKAIPTMPQIADESDVFLLQPTSFSVTMQLQAPLTLPVPILAFDEFGMTVVDASALPVAVAIEPEVGGVLVFLAFALFILYCGRQKVGAMLFEQTAKAERSAEMAKHEVEVKTTFLANMSHEIRTPLHAILSMGRMLLDSRSEDPNASQQDISDLSQLIRSSETLEALVNDILFISKMQTSSFKLANKTFDACELLEDITQLLALRWATKDVEVIARLEVPEFQFEYYSLISSLFMIVSLQLYADSLRLRQVLTNLATNAMKFTEQGNVELSLFCIDLHPDDDYASPSVDEAVPHVLFQVKDTGVGMDRDTMLNLFERFFQGAHSITNAVGGAGLGLAISAELVSLMGGTIGFENEATVARVAYEPSAEFILKRCKIPFASELQGIATKRFQGQFALVCSVHAGITKIVANYLKRWGLKFSVGTSVNAAFLAAKSEHGVQRMNQISVAIVDADVVAVSEEEKSLSCRFVCLCNDSHRRLLQTGKSEEWASCADHVLLAKPIKRLSLWNALVYDEPLPEETVPEATVAQIALLPRILLAEDNPLNVQIALRFLDSMGMKDVILARDGQQAVDKFATEGPFDLILMDCQMPNLDGFAATKLIRRYEHEHLLGREVPIVAMTAFSLPEDQEKCLDQGMNDYISKPFTKERMREKVTQWLRAAAAATPSYSQRTSLSKKPSFRSQASSPSLNYEQPPVFVGQSAMSVGVPTVARAARTVQRPSSLKTAQQSVSEEPELSPLTTESSVAPTTTSLFGSSQFEAALREASGSDDRQPTPPTTGAETASAARSTQQTFELPNMQTDMLQMLSSLNGTGNSSTA
ncbi:uncharacterized protein MONBRDRAFT_26982 [Monosiga brevicollis MX1]|uniref:Histidine kinase n=1 Tax=Monosiga brevicollis TaxID=81824 RepID=A9V3I0_MONBE|nr:uncharacterized protein MONBRDRAFT_26982 [Monosiga brevicollis MX1]EDQ87916.1 predicted protein [Monosiga brevicollis MX1]|eukprot:XP_001747449.1 hypothetical protein [Monosiga brevicollis MX1]